jgi:hypothetical protein
LVKDIPMIIHLQFGFSQFISFREENLWNFSQSEHMVNYCHHLVSVVCNLFTFQASSPKPLGQLQPNLAGIFLGWSSTKLLFFVQKKIFEISANQSILLGLAAMLNIRLERKTVTL